MGYSPVRRFERYVVQLLAIAVGTQPRLDHVHDLSRGGARISSRSAPAAGTEYTFLLIIPGSQVRAQVLKVPARVVWASAGYFGVKYDVSDAQFDRFVEQLAERAPRSNVTPS